MEEGDGSDALVSVIIPVHNADPWLNECLQSVCDQSYRPLEVSIFVDACNDKSGEIIQSWVEKLESNHVVVIVDFNIERRCKGAGYARNRAIQNSHGYFICLLDADDVMFPNRVALQLKAALQHPNCIIGSNFVRDPPASTERYTQWCNQLTNEQLILHQYRECTLIQPTWFMSKSWFEKVGGYDPIQGGPGLPEDMVFFHRHLDLGGGLFKVESPLVVYRYRKDSMSTQIHRLELLKVRLEAFERRVLSRWSHFTIWSAGRDGRKFFTMLDNKNKDKVVAFCDIDGKKVGTKYVHAWTKHVIPIIHYSQVTPPVVICVALDRTDGEFEKNVKNMNLIEGEDYYHFN